MYPTIIGLGKPPDSASAQAPWGRGHDPAPEGRNCSATILFEGWWGGDCEKTGDHDGSQAIFESIPQTHINVEFHSVCWHQWRLMWRLGLWREEWFDFLSPKISSWLCATLCNSSTVNYLPARSLWPEGSFFAFCHYFSIPTAVTLIRRFRNVHIFWSAA